MKINIKLEKKNDYGWTYYNVDKSEYNKVKYLSKDEIANKISSLNGICVDEIKNKYSAELEEKFQNNTKQFIKLETISNVSYPLTQFALNKTNKLTHDTFIVKHEIDLANKIIRIPMDYEASVMEYKTPSEEPSKWIQNYKNGASSKKGVNPFGFGDREKITYLESIMVTLGGIDLNVEYDGNVDCWKLYYYKPSAYQKPQKWAYGWTLDKFNEIVKEHNLTNKQQLRTFKGANLRKVAQALGVWDTFLKC